MTTHADRHRPPAILPSRRPNRYVDGLRASYATGEAATLGPMPPWEVPRVVNALRWAGTLAELGVRIRRKVTPDGVLVVYLARDRKESRPWSS